jgi:hypothetical protein
MTASNGARTRRGRPRPAAPERFADRHQRHDPTEARRRRACVALFVDVVAGARPTLTQADLEELRSWLYERFDCAPAIGLGDEYRLRDFDEVYPGDWRPGDAQAVAR